MQTMSDQNLPLRDRPLSVNEVEQMRLILSTFRDGSGQNRLRKLPNATSMPGFRDFERATAAVCGGETREDKGVFDVLVPAADGLPFGISCKMSRLQPPERRCAFMELTNSAARWADEFGRLRVSWQHSPATAGNAVIDLVTSWHEARSAEVDVARSQYFVLAHDDKWEMFHLSAFPISLKTADPSSEVDWVVEGRKNPSSVAGYIDEGGRRHRLWQLYPTSGGQLKYYPPFEWATSMSEPFRLEMPPAESLSERAREYFPELWDAATKGP